MSPARHSSGARSRLAAVAAALCLAACGVVPPTPPAAHTILEGACAGIRTTTSIDRVDARCAAEWRPYRVGEVPPSNLLGSLPGPQSVRNRTHGSVSDSDAQRIETANDRAAAWYRWALENDQVGILTFLSVVSADDLFDAVAQRATVSIPDCLLYPATVTLFPLDAAARAYFERRQEPTKATAVLVATFRTPCSAQATFPDGSRRALSPTTPMPVFIPGTLTDTPAFGEVWFQDAFGGCADTQHAPPTAWCATP